MKISEAVKPPGINALNTYGYQTVEFTYLSGTFTMNTVDNGGAMVQYQDVYLTNCYLTDVNVTFSDDYVEGAVSLFLRGNRKDVTVSLDNFANTSGWPMVLDLSGSNITELTFGDYDFGTDSGADIDISDNKLGIFPSGFWTAVEAMAGLCSSGTVNTSGENMPAPDQFDWNSIGFAQYEGWTISVNGTNAKITVFNAAGAGAGANGTYSWQGTYWVNDADPDWYIYYSGGDWVIDDMTTAYSNPGGLVGFGWDSGDPANGYPVTTLT